MNRQERKYQSSEVFKIFILVEVKYLQLFREQLITRFQQKVDETFQKSKVKLTMFRVGVDGNGSEIWSRFRVDHRFIFIKSNTYIDINIEI